METSDYTQKMQDLRKRVEYHGINNIENKNIPITKTFPNVLKTLSLPKPVIYIFPIIGVAILLFLSKPDFITMDNINIDINNINSDKDTFTKKIIYSNILIYSLLGGFIIDIVIWVYLNKKI